MGLPIGNGWGGLGEGQDNAALNARLHTVVLQNIVPRLALLHREMAFERVAEPPSPEDVEAFGQAILGADMAEADRWFRRLRERGLGVDELFEGLLAPAARRFGELWERDECDFFDVTVGVNRLRVMLETYANAPAQAGDPRRRALLIATPRERHLFGLDMVASFLRAAGWDMVLEAGRDAEDNASTSAESWFAVAGLTIGEEAGLEPAARAIEAVRRASANPGIAVIAGGRILQGRPDLVARIGADAGAGDGPSAALLAHKLYLAQASPALAF